MHAVEEGDIALAGDARHLFIGGEHEVLDQPLGLAPLAGTHVDRFAGRVQHELRLAQLEVDRAAFLARCREALIATGRWNDD